MFHFFLIYMTLSAPDAADGKYSIDYGWYYVYCLVSYTSAIMGKPLLQERVDACYVDKFRKRSVSS